MRDIVVCVVFAMLYMASGIALEEFGFTSPRLFATFGAVWGMFFMATLQLISIRR